MNSHTLDPRSGQGNPLRDGRTSFPPPASGIEYGTQVTSTGGGDGSQPIDPDFAGLFRPDDDPVPGPPPERRSARDAAPAPAVMPQPTSSPIGEPPPPAADPGADTGRLFRSQGVSDHPEAVLALGSDHFGRLRSLRRDVDVSPAAAAAVAVAATDSSHTGTPHGHDAPADLPGSLFPHTGTHEPTGADMGPVDSGLPGATAGTAAAAEAGAGMRHRAPRGRTLRAGAVYLIVIGVTVLVGFANALLSNGELGWPTGVALVVSSVYAALFVRREDDTVAFLTPPVAFLLAALTAGQLFIDALQGSLVNRAVVLFFTLAENWVWIIGATVAALVIVLIRRRR